MAVIGAEFRRGRLSHQPTIWGQITKRLTRPRRNKDWFERAKLVVAAARDRAVETAQQRGGPSMKRFPPGLQGRRWAESLTNLGPGYRGAAINARGAPPSASRAQKPRHGRPVAGFCLSPIGARRAQGMKES